MEITTAYTLGVVLLIAGWALLICLLAYSPSFIKWFNRVELIASDPIAVPAVEISSDPGVAVRPADAGPPVGAVAWVADIVAAIGHAPDGLVLASLVAGDSRDAARARWIAKLEETQLEETHVE